MVGKGRTAESRGLAGIFLGVQARLKSRAFLFLRTGYAQLETSPRVRKNQTQWQADRSVHLTHPTALTSASTTSVRS